MTDNRTIELLKDYAFALRRLEYDVDKPGSNMTLGEYEAEEKRVTDEYAKAIAAWNTRATGGTLTAEQVKRIHDCIEKHWHDLPAEYDMPEATALPEYSYDWQAIADELNVTLGDEWDGKPFVEYVEHVAKEIYSEAFALLEGCDEPDFSAIDAICAACEDMMRIADRWRRGR